MSKLWLAVLVGVALAMPAFAADEKKEPDKQEQAKGEPKEKAGQPELTKEEEAQIESVYGKPYILEVIEIDNEIGEYTVAQIHEAVENINENKRVKAVLLELNSPGGGAAASAAAYEELAKLNVPVVAWCDQMCASGAYYIAMAKSVKHIGVRKEAVAGSVGVIMHLSRYYRLLDWAKIDSETYASGRLKDAGNPTRAARDDEMKYLHGIIDSLAHGFYDVVAKSRKNIKDWDAVKTGRIFFGEEAVKMGLVDSVMDREDAVKLAKKLSGAKTIFTREEMKKMTKLAEGPAYSYKAPRPDRSMQIAQSDLHELVELVKEIHSGQSVTFKYILPYRF